MNILKKSVLTTLAALAVVSTTARAETFPVFEDAAGSPTGVIKKAAGTATTLPVTPKSNAFINFAVASSGYSASQVTAARLVVYFPSVTKPGNLAVAVGTAAFQEKLTTPSITVASLPGAGFDSIPVDASLKKSFYIVDVTAQVKNWLNNPNSEFGFVIASDGVANCTIGAKEGSGSGYPAVLEVDIAGGSTADGTFLFNGGNVGIGTTSPSHRLSVESSGVNLLSLSRNAVNGGTFDINYTGIQTAEGLYFSESGVNSSNLVLREGGNVGISTAFPSSKLDVNGGIKASGTDGYTFNSGDKDGGVFSPADGIVTLKTNNTERLRITENGNVGIGTDNPTQAKLVVAGSNLAPSSYTTEAFLDTAGAFNVSVPGENHETSIFADAYIRSNRGYIVSSDARTKTVLNVSDSAADLAALKQIQITDYQFKDTVSRGLQIQKKVIAQQIEPFCPQAIVKSTDVVPDIYKAASAKDGWIELNTDLKKGERVRLMADKTTGIYEVLEVRDGAFRTAFQPTGEKVFVYGREVNDFRTVDYDAIAMLNVSATQELAKQLAAKDASIAALEAKLAAFGEKLAALENGTPVRTARSEAPAPQPATVEVK